MRRAEIVRCDRIKPDPGPGSVLEQDGEALQGYIVQPDQEMHAGVGAHDFDEGPKVLRQSCKKGRTTRGVAGARAAQVTLEMALTQEIGQDLLFERGGMPVGQPFRRGKR